MPSVFEALASLPWYHSCQCQSGIVAVASLSSHRCRLGAGVVVVVAMACCRRRGDVVILLCQPGAGATIEASLLPLPLRCCHRCSCGAGVLADIATTPSPPSLGNCRRCSAGVLVALALLPSSLGHCAGFLACCDGHHRRLGAGAIFMSRWHLCRGCSAGVVVVLASSSRWYHCHRSVGIVAVAVMASLRLSGRASSPTWRWRHLLSQWRRYHHRSAGTLVVVTIGIIAIAAWVQLPLSRWRRCCRHGAGILAGVNQAPVQTPTL